MGVVEVITAIAAVVGVAKGIEDRNDAKANLRNKAKEDAKIRAETQAQQAARAAEERRAQVREERVRRARVLATSGGSGGAGSSGEFGAIGALGTNLATNIGSNLGRVQSGNNISEYSQNAADFGGKAQQNLMDAQQSDQLFNLSASMFSAAGGNVSSIFKTENKAMPLTAGGVQ